MRTILQSCLKLAALLPLAMGTAIAQDFDDVVINITPVAGGVSYIEGRGGNMGLFVGDDGVFLIDDQYSKIIYLGACRSTSLFLKRRFNSIYVSSSQSRTITLIILK